MRKLAANDLATLARRNREALGIHTEELQQMAATMRELDGASHEIAASAGRVSGAAERTLEQVRVGQDATAGIVEGLERIHANAAAVHEALTNLAQRMEGIGAAVEVIDDLSDRVDILALNAALEGARAGEAGKGLQVIAAEMRRLAERVVSRTKGIRALMEETAEATSAALQASERNRDVAIDGEELGLAARLSLAEIRSSSEETRMAANEIGIATLQQQEATASALRGIVSVTEASAEIRDIADALARKAE